MSYAPIMTPPTQTPGTSMRARQLSAELERVIDDFQKSYPDTKPGDVRDAMRLAWGGTSAERVTRARGAVAATIGAFLFAGLLALYFAGRGGDVSLDGAGVPWIMVMIGVLAIVSVAALLMNRD